MALTLNAFPMAVPNHTITALTLPYEQELLTALREQYSNQHAIKREKNNILIFSAENTLPVQGELREFDLDENYYLLNFLVKDSIKKHLAGLGRDATGFNPIRLISSKPEDDLLPPIVGKNYPFQVTTKYEINTRIIQGQPCLIIDCSTRRKVSESCRYFLKQGFDLVGRYVTKEQGDKHQRLLGTVNNVHEDNLEVINLDGEIVKVSSTDAYLEASIKNLDDYIGHTHHSQKDRIVEKLRIANSVFNGGENKRRQISRLKHYFQKVGIQLVDGTTVALNEAPDIQGSCRTLSKPKLRFHNGGSDDWTERGLTRHGPYTRNTFDRNNPSVCVICSQREKGIVEQGVNKFLKGMPQSKYFKNGLEGKFSIGQSHPEVFTTATDDVAGYTAAIEQAIQKKADEDGHWDLALVQIRKSFRKLDVVNNPYYWGKHTFFQHKVPVQDFTIELLQQNESSLGYSFNNMALASYAKMGGIPWLLKSSPTISHELVVGIGSANIGEGRGSRARVMGITTVFSGDGSYIVSNTSKAVSPSQYREALTSVLDTTIAKISQQQNWQKGDTIRLVFHASVKKFSKDEIQAVQAVTDKYRTYQLEYAFVKISEQHGLQMFDTANSTTDKGKYAPNRGSVISLSRYENLVYLIGQRELRQKSDGHPHGLIISIHRDSTFKDLTYITLQLFNFSAHSWRSYFPNPMPVTVSYSDLIAHNLGWLNHLPKWSDSILIGKIGQSQWFL